MQRAARGTVFLDYDGTLHDCMRLYGPAFRAAYAWLVREGHAKPQEFSDVWVARWLGWTVRDMWEAFMPKLPEPVWREASHIAGAEMDALLDAGAGALFPEVPAMLDELVAAGFQLALLSNCGEGYRDRHRAAFGLDRWFSAYYCAGAYPGLAKWQIYERAADACPRPHLVAGDRFHDIEVATRANIPSIGCAWGYGDEEELQAATRTAITPHELPALAKDLLG